MKQQENNQIDNLLRSWSGHQAAAPRLASDGSAAEHLDADELSSYAEGAVPPVARARYTAHLVECDDCRHIVSQLAMASGKALSEPAAEPEPAKSGWSKMLSAFFASAVMKFAVPALALIVVGALFLISRQQRDAGVSTNYGESARPTAVAPSAETQANAPIDSLKTKANSQEQTKANPQEQPAVADRTTKTAKGTPAAAKSEDRPADATATAVAQNEKKPEAAKETVTVTEEKSRPAGQVTAPAAPPPAPKSVNTAPAKDTSSSTVGGAVLSDKAARKREADKRDQDEVAADTERGAGRDDQKQKKMQSGTFSASGARRAEAGESHTIAGHSFQKRDGVWFDSAYKSGMTTTNVARGSEQYRALIADEPELDTIARQLSGEIYLVWKGRGYHIK
jgi:hypothetical protein